LERVKPSSTATKMAFSSADGFTTNLKLDYVRGMRDEPVLLAYAMNGVPIPLEHGYPIRLASPGKYGFKWPKWLTGIDFVDYDAKGHYEGRRGWNDDAERGKPVT